MNRYRHGRYKFIYVGIDFADAHDFTAVVVAEDPLYYASTTAYSPRVETELGVPSSDAMGWLSPLEMSPNALAELMEENNRWGFAGWPVMVVREIRRYRGIGYPRIIGEVKKFLHSRPFRGKRVVMGIVADRTGAGLPAIQEMHEKRIGPDAAIFIHGGYQDAIDARQPTFHNVAQRNLISRAQGQAEKGELKFNPALPLAGVAQKELANFRITTNLITAHESFGAPKREGEYDDIVYATAMALWYRDYHIRQEARYLDTYQWQHISW
jgi:hypothetical protein